MIADNRLRILLNGILVVKFDNIKVLALFLAFQVTHSIAAPLDESCQPKSFSDKAQAKLMPSKFWRSKIEELVRFKDARLREIRLNPTEYKMAMEQLRYEARRDRIDNPWMYEGDLAAETIALERANFAATHKLYRQLPAINRKWIGWADRCIAHARKKY